MLQPKKKIMLVNIYDGLYGGYWVGLAPYLLRAYARQFDVSKGFEITTRQFGSNDSIESIARAIRRESPDVVGLSLYVYNSRKTLAVVRELDCVVIIGGPQVTDDEEALLKENPQIDIIVTGEGEVVFKNLLEHFAGLRNLQEIPGITTRGFQTKPSIELVDLNTVPSVYHEIVRDHPRAGNICIETSRGCPYKCGYCAWSYDKKMRYFDLDRVLQDFSIISEHKSARRVYLADASLFFNKERAVKILRHIIALAPKQEFFYELNVEHVDDELIDLMAQLPNQDFSFGIQTVDPKANAEIGRSFNAERFREKFQKMARKLDKAQLSVDIMYPLPGDTLRGFKESIEFALSLEKVHLIKFNALILLPGSEFFRNREKHGFRLRDQDLRLVESCRTFSREEVSEAIKYANYAVMLHSNAKLKRCVQLLAMKREVGMLDILEEVINSMPFDLYDGQEIPEMITAEMNDEQFMIASAPAYFNYAKLVASFKEYSQHEYDHLLVDWRKSFLDVGPLRRGLLLKLIWLRVKKTISPPKINTVRQITISGSAS